MHFINALSQSSQDHLTLMTKWVSLSYLNYKRIENSVHVFAESDQGSAEPVGVKKVWLMKINEKLWCLILVLAHHL